jgi:D-inositol-3-phosphate glycosyltransferase
LSGQVGAVAKERWGVPLVQSMHTLGKVKNAALAAGDAAEPDLRIRGEAEVIATADRIVANTSAEARELTRLYDADPRRVATVSPGVDLSLFTPGSKQQARWNLGIPQDAIVLMFAGRVQPLKAPDVLLRAAARLVTDHGWLAGRLVVAFVGGPSGTGRNDPDSITELAAELGISRNVRLEPPCPQADLANWYRAATLVVVPSYSESFGLVAVEAQACGTPVVAAAAGGLRTAVRDGFSGVLVDGHDPARYAKAIWHLISDTGKLARLALGARQHASGFGWSVTVDQLLGVYGAAMSEVTAGAAPVDA